MYKTEEDLRRRRRIGGGIAAATAGAVILTSALVPMAASALDGANAEDPSVAQARILDLDADLLAGLDLAAIGETFTSYPSAPGTPAGDVGSLDVNLINDAVLLDLGNIQLPLLDNGTNNGLLSLGNAGALSSFSVSPSSTQSTAAAGVLGANGAIDLDGVNGNTSPANLELTDLLDQLGVSAISDQLIDEAAIEIGALAARAEKNGTTLTDEYAIAGLDIDVHSPAVSGLVQTLDTTVGNVTAPIDALLAPGGGIQTLVANLVDTIGALPLVDASLNELSLDTSGLVDSVRTQLLQAPLENADGSISINLNDGTIHVDLAQVLLDSTGATDLNSLGANTDVLSGAVVTSILDGVTDALIGAGPNSLVSKLVNLVTDGIYSLQLVVDIQADISLPILGPLVDAPVTINSSVGGLLGVAGYPAAVIDTSGINVAGIPLGTVLQPIINALTGLVSSVGGVLTPVGDGIIQNLQPTLIGVVQPVVTDLLDNALEPLLEQVVDLTINAQPETADGSFALSALSLTLLPALAGGVQLDLASVSSKALDAAAVAAVDAADTVQAGTDLAIEGSGWPAETELSVQLTAPNEGPNVGEAQTIETDVNGAFTLDYPVPADAAAAPGYTVTATAGEITATDTTEVTAAAASVDAADTVPAGTSLAVSGTGWPADSDVTLQLTTPDGETNVGGPETAETNGTGAFTFAYPVPADTEPGTGYILTATSGETTAEDTTEVTAGDPGDANTNAAASASASADATADADPAAQAAAVAAALADATSSASAEADATASAAAEVAATADASSEASATATSDVNASAAVAAQAAAQADASDDVNASASTAANANSSSSSEAAATADSSSEASAEASTNANAAASASASANADATTAAVAEAAAQASAYSDDDASASAAATAAANAAAESAATATSTTDATTDATSEANAGAAIAAQAAALADATSNTAAEASADADASTSAASNASAAAIADASTDASSDATSTAETNTNATASAAASAQADDDNNAAAQAAAVAAALADASTAADAAADPDAEAAAAAAATSTADASVDATSEANVAAAASAQAAAQADNSSDTNADATQEANANASSAASVAATATSSADASQEAAADATATATTATDATATTATDATATTTADATASADASTAADAEVDTNASASAAASANADDDSNASVEAAAVAAALADATTTASAAADVTANAAAEAAANVDASSEASTNADAEAAAAAQAAAQNDATSTSAANADAEADADPNAAAAVAANAASTSTASATAAADASAEATAEASAQAAAAASADATADAGTKLGIIIKVPVLERGGTQTAIGTGFLPGEKVTGVMTSDPLALGTQIADAQGNVTFTWAVPSTIDLGTHTVTLSGETSGSVAATFQLVANNGLATTGGELPNPWILMGALLLLFGLGTALVGRGKRATVDAA
ncbi:choice-of-anchor G family protein [Microbacterium sp. ZW T5_45]|uniref:choice-of-anchor G family protein n=1 Tax=Microbacterium sp. ZW T5_45 TaxID=3378080 RepID=UPI003853DFAE